MHCHSSEEAPAASPEGGPIVLVLRAWWPAVHLRLRAARDRREREGPMGRLRAARVAAARHLPERRAAARHRRGRPLPPGGRWGADRGRHPRLDAGEDWTVALRAAQRNEMRPSLVPGLLPMRRAVASRLSLRSIPCCRAPRPKADRTSTAPRSGPGRAVGRRGRAAPVLRSRFGRCSLRQPGRRGRRAPA